MNLLEWLTSTRHKGSAVLHAVPRLIDEADRRTVEQWELVNQARLARGEPPIESIDPFRPRDLIDPRPGEGHV